MVDQQTAALRARRPRRGAFAGSRRAWFHTAGVDDRDGDHRHSCRFRRSHVREQCKTAIDSYTIDKQKAPQSLDDLVQSGYLKSIPKDPITNRTDTWMPVTSDTLSTIDQSDQGGIDDVHSGAQQTGTDGSSYNTW